MSELLPLTGLPEWSDFFRSLIGNGTLRVSWSEEGGRWFAQAWEFSCAPDEPLCQKPFGDRCEGDDKFEVLHALLKSHGSRIKKPVWEAFYAFRGAATGHADDIEDLL